MYPYERRVLQHQNQTLNHHPVIIHLRKETSSQCEDLADLVINQTNPQFLHPQKLKLFPS